jgi:ATP-dependent helicase/nuclease subunit A
MENVSPPVSSTGALLSDYQERVESVVNSLSSLVENCGIPENDRGYQQIAKFKRELMIFKGLDRNSRIRFLLGWKTDRSDLGDKKAWKDDKEQKKELCEQLRETLDDFRFKISDSLFQGCSLLLMDFLRLIEEEKFKHRMLTFDDILIKTRNLLRDNRQTREYYKNKFKKILVDEFQDTDPLQAEIVFFLSEKPGEFKREWSSCTPGDGKAVIVGDPKQSIYSFRRADIEIYENVKSIIEGNGKSLNITVNFRTLSRL